jgi:glycine/D-amino acid oxidase-like deaminating enzyme
VARAAEAAGVVSHGATRVTAIEPGVVRTAGAAVTADGVLRCTEGYTPGLDGHHRDLIPVYSLMVATEPMDDAHWSELGFSARETFSDGRRLLIYAQRTSDGRLALGGRGAPYHFGSAVKDAFDRDRTVADHLRDVMWELFPATRDARITHHWGGPAATSATACRPPTWPGGPWSTSCSTGTRSWSPCRGSSTGHVRGSRSRSGGSA